MTLVLVVLGLWYLAGIAVVAVLNITKALVRVAARYEQVEMSTPVAPHSGGRGHLDRFATAPPFAVAERSKADRSFN